MERKTHRDRLSKAIYYLSLFLGFRQRHPEWSGYPLRERYATRIVEAIFEEEPNNVEAVLMALRFEAFDRIANGEFGGISESCESPLDCAAWYIARQRNSAGKISLEILVKLKGCLKPSGCVHYCTENPENQAPVYIRDEAEYSWLGAEGSGNAVRLNGRAG